MADYLDLNPHLVRGKNVLELGAGGALPSLICACNLAKKVLSLWGQNLTKVVITDYPDTELIENIRYNVTNCGLGEDVKARIAVEGYLWGNDVTTLLSHLELSTKFNVVILSDTVHIASSVTN